MVTTSNWDSHLVGHKSQKYTVTNCSKYNAKKTKTDFVETIDRFGCHSRYLCLTSCFVLEPSNKTHIHVANWKCSARRHANRFSSFATVSSRGECPLLIALLGRDCSQCSHSGEYFWYCLRFSILFITPIWLWLYSCNSSVVSGILSIKPTFEWYSGSAWSKYNGISTLFCFIHFRRQSCSPYLVQRNRKQLLNIVWSES